MKSNPLNQSGGSDIALFDRDKMMRQFAGDETLAGAVLESYWADVGPLLEALAGAITDMNRQELKSQAHTLVGLAGYICSDELCAAALHLESNAMQLSAPELVDSVAEIGRLNALLRAHEDMNR